jgi:hypothetical protein
MTPLVITLTKAGLAAIVSDDAPTLGPATITQIGLTNTDFSVASTLTALPGEFKRIGVSGEAAGDDVLHIIGLDASADTYGYTGFGIYLADGTLFAVYGQPGLIAEKAAVSSTYLALDVQLAQGQTANIIFGDTNFLNPPATTDRQGVIELATQAEATEGDDTYRAVTPATAKGAVLAWIGFTPLDALAFTKAAILALLGYTPLDALAFTKAAILGLLGYTPQDAAASSIGSNANGNWERRPNGILEQWGAVTAGETSNPTPLTFPQPFADTASVALIVSARTPNIAATSGNKVDGDILSPTQFVVSSDDGSTGVFWRAIGKAA